MATVWTYMGFGKYLPFIGRILLGLIFVFNGFIKFSDLSGTAGYIELYNIPMPMVMAVIAAIVELSAGLMLMAGFHARIAAFVLASYTLIVTAVFHNQLRDPLQSTMALKNLAITGGLLYAAKFGSGMWSIRQRSCGCCADHSCGNCGASGTCSGCADHKRGTVPPPMGA